MECVEIHNDMEKVSTSPGIWTIITRKGRVAFLNKTSLKLRSFVSNNERNSMTVQEAIEELMKLAWQGYHSKEIKVLIGEHWEEPAFIIQEDEVHIV
jgi:hypothetical protein